MITAVTKDPFPLILSLLSGTTSSSLCPTALWLSQLSEPANLDNPVPE